ncbi:hypothetical protein [Niabella soli]|uniref:hypothetical protein n=1 Tax=Niabella soli TaxID=446683 RepID=UPI0002499E19|nr:hypothetical protein [Niabella soli]
MAPAFWCTPSFNYFYSRIDRSIFRNSHPASFTIQQDLYYFNGAAAINLSRSISIVPQPNQYAI